jgi:transcriptional regulator with XRE-family HTH domain
MRMKDGEKKVLAEPGAAERVAEIGDELRLAAGLTALREQAGLSQRDVARLLGVSQPRIAAIEKSRNVTIDVLERYVEAVGGQLDITVRKGNRKFALVVSRSDGSSTPKPRAAAARSSRPRREGRRPGRGQRRAPTRPASGGRLLPDVRGFRQPPQTGEGGRPWWSTRTHRRSSAGSRSAGAADKNDCTASSHPPHLAMAITDSPNSSCPAATSRSSSCARS